MSIKEIRIVVNGDACIGRYQWSAVPKDSGYNWQTYPGSRRVSIPGGTLLLGYFLNTISKYYDKSVSILCPELPQNIDNLSKDMLYSEAEIGLFPVSSDKKDKDRLVLRVRKHLGFAGPDNGIVPALDITDDDPDADIVILDDLGNGFREQEDKWPSAIRTPGKTPWVMYRMAKPLMSGKLWEHVYKNHFERLILIVEADDLRGEGVNISRCLSWERTAMDFTWQIARNPRLLPLVRCKNLLLRLGHEGTVHYTNNGKDISTHLYFYPDAIEDGFKTQYPGQVGGTGSIFLASMALKAADGIGCTDMAAAIGSGIKCAMTRSSMLLKHGYGTDISNPDFYREDILKHSGEDMIGDAIIPSFANKESSEQPYWCILSEIGGTRLEDLAYDIVRIGDKKVLKSVPVGHFGKLRAVDRSEIESFRSIKNLMLQYIEAKNTSRPLSIGVFGFPGSGKSFGVTEVAESIAQGLVEKMEFNLSQFSSLSDLTGAFHKVRDVVLKGNIPLVFFDEFDSAYDGKLGWLKYFLAPMQDGVFREGESTHPIGKAIFVFAGGTCSTFQEFSREDSPKDSGGFMEFKDAKGPDFISRLRGYVNISGPNPINTDDFAFIIRRAMLLRSFIERKVKQIIDSRGNVRIDEGVLRALIKVPFYRHGARSMEAIIDMSTLNGSDCWEQADLPSKEQLKLHVDEEMLIRLMGRDVIFGSAREMLGRAVHERYVKDQTGRKSPDDASMQPWEILDEGYRESSRCQADRIPEKLRYIGCGYTPVKGREPRMFNFKPDEIERLAIMEHEGWVSEKMSKGWAYGEKKDDFKKLSPYIIPWDELTEDIKEIDRQAVRNIPELLAMVGFELYRISGGYKE